MLIKTTKPDLLILDTCYSQGATVDVPDQIGKRLVERSAAVAVLDDRGAADEVGAEEVIETAMLPSPRERAVKRV